MLSIVNSRPDPIPEHRPMNPSASSIPNRGEGGRRPGEEVPPRFMAPTHVRFGRSGLSMNPTREEALFVLALEKPAEKRAAAVRRWLPHHLQRLPLGRLGFQQRRGGVDPGWPAHYPGESRSPAGSPSYALGFDAAHVVRGHFRRVRRQGGEKPEARGSDPKGIRPRTADSRLPDCPIP